MEYPVAITNLNDFIFCPASIYFHMLDQDTEKMLYQNQDQINGTAAHKSIDTQSYSTSKNILQGISVFSEKYGLFGRIDIYDADKCKLTERKKKIKEIYDGYIFQIYAQYFSLVEMGFPVRYLCIHSIDDNKSYDIPLPENDTEMAGKFEKLILDMRNFDFDGFSQNNEAKCQRCIYEPLCSFSRVKQ